MGNIDLKIYFENLLNIYNQAWYDKDIEKLKEFYDLETNNLIYFDNHKNNDTYTVTEHLQKVGNFFKNGKQTESGKVENLIIEDFNVFANETSACLCYVAKYESFPKPAIRTTMYAELINGKCKFKQIHCSFEPNY